MARVDMVPSHTVTAAHLKWLAVVTMIIDHAGFVIWPQIGLMRLIGRISFPLYIFLLVEGFYYTGSRGRYLSRLLILAFVSEIPFDMGLILSAGDIRFGMFTTPLRQNVMWTLVLGFFFMFFYEMLEKKICNKKTPRSSIGEKTAVLLLSLPATAVLTFAAEKAATDYRGYGVAAVIGCFLAKKWGAPYWFMFMVPVFILQSNPEWDSELFAAAAAPVLLLYQGDKGRSLPKYFFYAVYPVHLLILTAVKLFVLP